MRFAIFISLIVLAQCVRVPPKWHVPRKIYSSEDERFAAIEAYMMRPPPPPSKDVYYLRFTHNPYFKNAEQISKDPEYLAYRDPLNPERIWRQVKLVSHWYKWWSPNFYHTSVQVADPSLYRPDLKYNGAMGYDVGQSTNAHEISGQRQFLRTEINSRPKGKLSADKSLYHLRFDHICMTDRTHEELLARLLAFTGPYDPIRCNCQDQAEWMLSFMCGENTARYFVKMYRNPVFELKKHTSPHVIDPNYKWHFSKFEDEEARAKKAADNVVVDDEFFDAIEVLEDASD